MDRSTILLGLLFVIDFDIKAQETVNLIQIKEGYESEYYYAFTEATRLMIYQNFDNAISLYQKCLEYNPNSAAIKYQLSVIYYKLGKMYEAVKLGKEAYTLERNNRWYLMNLINIYQTTNQLDSAIILTKELINLEPENIENQFNLAVLYQIIGDFRTSLTICNSIEKNYGSSSEIFINKYKIYTNLGKEKQALKQLKMASAKIPYNYGIVGLIAEYYRDAGAKDSSEKYYKVLLEENGNDPVTLFSYLDYLLKYRQYNMALKCFVTSVNNPEIQKEQILGYFINQFDKENELKEHNSFYDTAISYFYDKNRNDLRINELFVDYQLKDGNYSIASSKLKELILNREMGYRVWDQLLFAENAMGHYDSVLNYGSKVIEIFEYQSLPYLYMGIAYQQLKRFDQAIQVLEKGLRLTDNKNVLIQFYSFLAQAYNEVGENMKSFDHYEKALAIDSKNVLIMNNYAYFLALDNSNLDRAETLSRYTLIKEKRNCIYLDTYAWILYKMKRNGKAKHYIKKAVKYGGKLDKEIIEHYTIIMGN